MLVLMACSATKRPDGRKSQPAHTLYDGPMWQTLKTHKPRSLPWNNVLVLSAMYGVISATAGIGPYEKKLTSEQADLLIERGIDAPNDHIGTMKYFTSESVAHLARPGGPHGKIIVAASGDYRRVFDALIGQLIRAGICGEPIKPGQKATHCNTLYTCGGIGEQRQQLGEWLRS